LLRTNLKIRGTTWITLWVNSSPP